MTAPTLPRQEQHERAWPALWALVIGFFMILVDSTIVSVAMPAIMRGLGADITDAVWVNSAYLLTYAVPLLIFGRLGDRLGPKNLYLSGLVVFTAASLWCGLAGSVEALILARAVQGLGAALMTPQTMAVITRIFPPDKRGTAMALWGSTAGVATLVGPILGGVLVDSLGWEWIFFVNVPVGVVGFVLAFLWVPRLETHDHHFDILGVVLSAVAMFLLVFGIQEGERYDWGTITGILSVPLLLVAGVVVLAAFIWWQARNRREPLVPFSLFADRNFAVSVLAISCMGFIVTCMGFPMALFAQVARGLSPTQSALLMLPMALISAGLAPVVGRWINTHNPRWLAVGGFALLAVSLAVYWQLMSSTLPIAFLLIPSALMGVANSGIWGPLSVSATRNLPPRQAGAGSGVYNAIRQFGGVVGSAAIAAMMTSRLAVHLPGAGDASAAEMAGGGALPAALSVPFGSAMGESLLLPAALALVGVAAVWFLSREPVVARQQAPVAAEPAEA